MSTNLTETSKYMSMLLRHAPEKGNITVDTQGYTDVNSLLKALNIDKPTLDKIVASDNKKRYSYNKDGTRIRANQGHSLSYVQIDFKEYTPNGHIYHGTAKKFYDGIMKQGLISQSRNYVHLSKDLDTAINVGMRHAKSKINLVVFEIDYKSMIQDGYKFYISENGVVLTEKVPKKYLKQVNV